MMGGNTSSPEKNASTSEEQVYTAKDERYLIGDLDHLPPNAQKIFKLGQRCLNIADVNPQNIYFSKLEQQFEKREDNNPKSDDLPISSSSCRNEKTQPSHDAQGDSAAGASNNLNLQELSEYDSLGDLFQAFKQTAPLYLNQTYTKWKSAYDFRNMVTCGQKRTIIYIQPLDEFPDFVNNFRFSFKGLHTDLFGLLQIFTQIFFRDLDSSVNEDYSLDELGWSSEIKTRVHSVTGQKQQRASDFYPLLRKILPSNGICIIGITWTDLYPTDDLNFVFGETSLQHKCGIFCFGRFEPKAHTQFHEDIHQISGDLIWKLMKVMSHELCHVFGLEHCTFFKCLMNASSSMSEALEQPLFLCPICLRKLHKVCKFDVLERYSRLLCFLEVLETQLPSVYTASAICWLQQCIAYLEMESEGVKTK